MRKEPLTIYINPMNYCIFPRVLKELKATARFIFTEHICDCSLFHEDPDLLRSLISDGKIIIRRCYQTMDDMTMNSRIYWYHSKSYTNPNSFNTAIQTLQNPIAIQKIAKIVEEFGVPWTHLNIAVLEKELLFSSEDSYKPVDDDTIIKPSNFMPFKTNYHDFFIQMATHLDCETYLDPFELSDGVIPIRFI